jgi:hypothetical protein
MILAPLDPVSLSHVGVPLGATAGDLWGWFPWSYWDFQTVSFVNNSPTREVQGQSGTAHVINISLSYQF